MLPIQAERLFSRFLEPATGTPWHLLLIIYGQIFILFILQSKCVLQLLFFLMFSWFVFCIHFWFHPCISQFILGFHLIGWKLYDIALSEIDNDTAKQDLKFSQWFFPWIPVFWDVILCCWVSVSGAQGFIYSFIFHFSFILWILTRSNKHFGYRNCQCYVHMHTYRSICLIYNEWKVWLLIYDIKILC